MEIFQVEIVQLDVIKFGVVWVRCNVYNRAFFFKRDLCGYLQVDAGAKRKVILMLIGSLDIVNVICVQINKCFSTEM